MTEPSSRAAQRDSPVPEVEPLLAACGLVKQYGSTRVVDSVSLSLYPGETLGLVGESGSGKSTVARMLLRLVEPTAGSILYRGTDLLAIKPRAMRAVRRHLQIVFQDPFAALNPRMRVRDVLAEPLIIHADALRTSHNSSARPLSRIDRLLSALAEVGLDASALPRFPHEFSGGQRQRINIARALMLQPEILILDEPVSALDVSVGAQIINLLRTLQRTHGLTYLFISHSMPLVRYLCDRVAVMQRGRIVETGDCLAVCEHPHEPYTQRLIAATPEIRPEVQPQ